MATSILGETIGRYQIVEEIGRGGLAVVYRAVDTVLQRSVAVKMILPDQQQTEKFLKRFNREAKTLAGLSHPSIVKVLDYGEFQNTPYLVMEYIPGGTLSSRMGRMYPYTEAAAILAPIARALYHAHQHKVVHRDVKPANILINESGQTMLSDFGIVKLTETDESQSLTGTGVLVGTPAYMAPEQIQGKPIDGRVDIYALGIVFFELITGRRPYIANTPIELTLKHLNDPIPRPRLQVRDLPPEVEQIVMKAMAKKPEDRYQDMALFAAVLERLAAGQKGSLRLLERPPEKKKRKEDAGEQPKKRFNKGVLLGGGAGLLAAAGLAFGLVVYPNYIAPALQNPTPATAIAGVTVEPTATATRRPPTAAPSPTHTPVPPTATTSATETPSGPPPAATSTPLQEGRIQKSNIGQVAELNRLEKVSVIQMDWTRDGSVIVDAGANRIRLVDPATLKETQPIELGNDIPKAIALSSDSQRVFTLIGNQVRIYTLSDRKEQKRYNFQGGANSLAITGDMKTVALGMSDNKVLLVDAETGTVSRTLSSSYGGWSVAFSPDGKLIAAGTSRGALMWETETGTWQPLSSGESDLIRSLAYSSDGKLLVGGSDNIVRIWEVATGSEVGQITGSFGQVLTLQFSPDNMLLATGSSDSTIRLYEAGTWKELRQLKGHVSPVFSVVFSPTGQRLASGANEGIIRLWGLP